MKVALDLHDFSVVQNRLDVLLKLKSRFSDFKVSMFTVPNDSVYDWGSSLIRNDLLKEVKKHLDWIQIIPHGLWHTGSEVDNCDKDTFDDYFLPRIVDAFNRDGLPFENGFVAPHWRWTQDVVDSLDEAGWWGAIDRDKKMPCPKRFYQYNYLLNESFWESDKEVLKLHGHVYGTKNDVWRCFDNLLKLPLDTEWYYVTDFLEDKK